MSLIGIPSSPIFYAAFLFTVLVFLSTGWFLFKFLGVGRMASPVIDQEFLDLSPGKKKAAYVRDRQCEWAFALDSDATETRRDRYHGTGYAF